ncbi:MAG: hypothetical protein ACP5XB_17500 [Isosphaeraceae bacterium]
MNSPLARMGFTLAVFLGVGTLSWSLNRAHGQTPGNQPPAPAGNPAAQPVQARNFYPDHIRPQAYFPQRRRSIVHHYAYPYPSFYNDDTSAGFRNPGNIGRHSEYYYPGEQFQTQGDPVRVAQFGVGGYPSRSEQLAAQQVGIARYNSIQQHIDRMAMPGFGFGFGVGGFGGFW